MGTAVRCRRPALSAVPLFLLGTVLLTPARAAAQEPVKSFEQLNTRLEVGDTVWVTDASGREVKGKISALSNIALALGGGAGRTFQSSDVRMIVERPHDSLKFGTLMGLGIGVGIAFGLVIAAHDDIDGGGILWGIAAFGGVGAGIGCAIDAMIPMPKQVVYRSPGGVSLGRVSLLPMVGPRSRGVAVSFAF